VSPRDCRQTVINGPYHLEGHGDVGTFARMDMTVIPGDDQIAHVVLDGRFDIQGAQEVDSRFEDLSKSSKALVVDLAKVSFLASLGIRTLMLSAKTLIRSGGEMAVCGANESVEKVLRTTGFNEVAGIYPDYESAARTVRERLGAFSARKA
jgi:anti-anti-sigma factor